MLLIEYEVTAKLAKYCKDFRTGVLRATLKDISGIHSLKTLSAFETGRNKNLQHIFKYYYACPDARTKRVFLIGLSEIIEGLVYDE